MKRVNEKFDSSVKDAEFIAGVGCALLLMAAGADVLQILMGSGTESPTSNTSVRE